MGMGFKDLLKIIVAKEGSDLFLTADAPPSIKAFGHMVPLGSQVLPAGSVEAICCPVGDGRPSHQDRHPQL